MSNGDLDIGSSDFIPTKTIADGLPKLPQDRLMASVKPTDDYGSYGDDSGENSEGELDSSQKQKLRRDLAMMGYDDDEEFDEINEANARLMMGAFDMTSEAFKQATKGLSPE